MNTCGICGHTANHPSFQVREMQHCLQDSFTYFQCNHCFCIQIASIPDDIGQYYPSDYYSFSDTAGNSFLKKRADFFHREQARHFTEPGASILAGLFAIGYQPPLLFDWLKRFSVGKNDRVLDIGSGAGLLLKKMWYYGYNDLTGVDPFIPQDYHYPGQLSILKKDPLELDESRPFDFVMMHHSLEHMSGQDAIMQKIGRLLKAGGKLLVRVPVYSKVLMERYGASLVSLDAPRHFFIHSTNSLQLLAERNGFQLQQTVFDADSSSFWASEQYKRGICLNAPNSYGVSRKAAPFSKAQIRGFKKEIKVLNRKGESDTAAFYLVKK